MRTKSYDTTSDIEYLKSKGYENITYPNSPEPASIMKKVFLFKIIIDTKVFKKGQNVFATWHKHPALHVAGRYKGKGRWLSAWIHLADCHGKFCEEIGRIDKSRRGRQTAKYLGEIEVPEELYDMIDRYEY